MTRTMTESDVADAALPQRSAREVAPNRFTPICVRRGSHDRAGTGSNAEADNRGGDVSITGLDRT